MKEEAGSILSRGSLATAIPFRLSGQEPYREATESRENPALSSAVPNPASRSATSRTGERAWPFRAFRELAQEAMSAARTIENMDASVAAARESLTD
jgi:hypothetical protein